VKQNVKRGGRRRPRITSDRVLDELRRAGQPLSLESLIEVLRAEALPEQQTLQTVLESLEHHGAVLRNRRGQYLLGERLALVIGTVTGHRDGYGFVQPDDRSEVVFLPPRQMLEVIHGDRVVVRVSGTDRRGRPEGTVVEILERSTQEVVGRLYDEEGICFVVPDNPRIVHRVLVPRRYLSGARPGQVVVVRLVEQPGKTTQALGHVTRVLGEHAAPGMETEIAIHSHGLPFEFSAEVMAEAAALGDGVPAHAKRGREDLRQVRLVTIDGEDARDFDDAVHAERIRSGWLLRVAIADVGHYVQAGSTLDQEALGRGTSVYFPNRVLPMLPESLSNGLCSLNPGVDRLCIVCEMRVSPQGSVTRSRFLEGVMRSAARLTYTQVARFLETGDPAQASLAGELNEPLRELYGVYQALYAAREKRGALDFDAPEVKIVFDEQGRIAALREQRRNDAHRLIEECMIAANVEAARFLKKHRIPALFRVHGQPEEDRLEQLRVFLGGFGISLPADRPLEPADLNAVLHRATLSDEARLIETVVLRSLPQAVYQPDNIGHFGLALPEYSHFTSPIRRYPDLLVHRGIRHVLRGGASAGFEPDAGEMVMLGQQCSARERRADEATRDAVSWLKCEYMQERIGEEFDAIVTGVVDFGLFVQLKGLQVDGLVHVSALGAEYYSRDRSGYRMIGSRSGRSFRLGDHLRVRLINVIVDERKIDFELAERSAERGPVRRQRGLLRRQGRRRR